MLACSATLHDTVINNVVDGWTLQCIVAGDDAVPDTAHVSNANDNAACSSLCRRLGVRTTIDGIHFTATTTSTPAAAVGSGGSTVATHVRSTVETMDGRSFD